MHAVAPFQPLVVEHHGRDELHLLAAARFARLLPDEPLAVGLTGHAGAAQVGGMRPSAVPPCELFVWEQETKCRASRPWPLSG
jgi:hypothetical protein